MHHQPSAPPATARRSCLPLPLPLSLQVRLLLRLRSPQNSWPKLLAAINGRQELRAPPLRRLFSQPPSTMKPARQELLSPFPLLSFFSLQDQTPTTTPPLLLILCTPKSPPPRLLSSSFFSVHQTTTADRAHCHLPLFPHLLRLRLSFFLHPLPLFFLRLSQVTGRSSQAVVPPLPASRRHASHGPIWAIHQSAELIQPSKKSDGQIIEILINGPD